MAGAKLNNIDMLWLAINAYHEARGEGLFGMKAVCHVVLNRVLTRRLTVKEVILQRMQFSWANSKPYPSIKDYDSFEDCMMAAIVCVRERENAGITLDGAEYYLADYIDPPSWLRTCNMYVK